MSEVVIVSLVILVAGLLYFYNRSLTGLRKQKETIEGLRRTLMDTEQDKTYKLALALTLANSAYDALLVVDKDCRIIAINDSAETLTGREGPIGERLADVTGCPELEMMVEDVVANEEEVYEGQVTIRERPHRVRVKVIRREGNMFIGLALQDVSDLVRLNRARRDMVANISHELRTPIANIRLIIDSLFHEDEKPKRKRSISSLQAIARETDSLLWIMQEMLDLSMIESGQAIMRMVEVPLKGLVDEAIERMEDQSDAKELKISHDVPKDLQVLADPDQARRVLVNLLHNAVKWSPRGESIKIHAVNGGDEVTVSVIDSGPGVPDDQVERIFERFYQVDTSRSGHGGTGLGLAICKHIVEAHDGRIWAEGRSKGPGGRFMFTLPSAN
jgi:two-component system phosphate regulon sensor histidine kinase PhoR